MIEGPAHHSHEKTLDWCPVPTSPPPGLMQFMPKASSAQSHGLMYFMPKVSSTQAPLPGLKQFMLRCLPPSTPTPASSNSCPCLPPISPPPPGLILFMPKVSSAQPTTLIQFMSKVSSVFCVYLSIGWPLLLLPGTMLSITVLFKPLQCLTWPQYRNLNQLDVAYIIIPCQAV
ncbi:hypothetical protein BsWGS_25446 [Bradybaena similaris]